MEFKTSIVDSDPWQWVWSTEGIDDDTAFHPVVIPIDGTEYFHNGFQFRIRNYGSLEGNVDTWHLDFVRVAEDGGTPAPLFEEVSFVTPPSSMLTYPWTAMPWPSLRPRPCGVPRQLSCHPTSEFWRQRQQPRKHWVEGSARGRGWQRQQLRSRCRRASPTTPFRGFLRRITSTIWTCLSCCLTLRSATFATFHVSLWEDEVGAANLTSQTGVSDNDSLVHVQVFRDYYAYDDGTAEKAYALDGQGGGGEVVVAFDFQQPTRSKGFGSTSHLLRRRRGRNVHAQSPRGGRRESRSARQRTGDTIHHSPAQLLRQRATTASPTFLLRRPSGVDGIYVGFVQQGRNASTSDSTNPPTPTRITRGSSSRPPPGCSLKLKVR